MSALGKRLSALEGNAQLAPERWHWIVGEVGEDMACAWRRYEHEQEPIREGEHIVFWEIV